jgi:hypothetical protein
LSTTFVNRHLMSDGVLECYRAITARYGWFLHVAYREDLQNYRASGLRPGNPGRFSDKPLGAPPAVFRDALTGLGRTASNVLCLRPTDSQAWKPTKPGAKFVLAFKKENLPRIVSIDWSYPECITLAEQLHEQQRDRPLGEIFVEVAQRLGSFAVYDPVAARALRIWTHSLSADDPAKWPMLAAASDADVKTID